MRKLENKTLDEIAKVLVTADAPSPRDIESIISNPALFDSIRARAVMAEDDPAPRRFKFRPAAVASFASIALVGALAVELLVFNTKSVDLAAVPIPEAPGNHPTPKKFSQPDEMASTGFSRSQPVERSERTSIRPEVTDVKITRPKQSAAQQIRYEGDGDFYALSYAGDPNETERGGRIVRVDIPRSTLFAMGVDVPLENESDTVKADLLIGSDGVTRAIRVVK
ncbi:MAG: hypothetical protein ABI481_06990 [Pyrinomonadaceae bacterium]